MVKKFLSDLGFDDVEDNLLTGHSPAGVLRAVPRDQPQLHLAAAGGGGDLYHFEHRGKGTTTST